MEEDFDQIWEWIIQNEGELFHKKRGAQFTYEVTGDKLQIIGNAPFPITRDNFFNAFPHFDPLELGTLPPSIVAPSYVWGIFNGFYNQIQ